MVKPPTHSQDNLGSDCSWPYPDEFWKSPGTPSQDCCFCEQPHLKLDFSHDREVRTSLVSTCAFFLDFLPYATLKRSSCRHCPCHLPAPHVCSEQSQRSHFLLTGQVNLTLNHLSDPSLDLLLFILVFFCIERENDVLFSVIKCWKISFLCKSSLITVFWVVLSRNSLRTHCSSVES